MALRASRSSVGERLHQARTDRGLSLDRVAEDTKIDRSCLEALERDLPPHDHHGGIYARIFLREYARYLGLNARPLVESYRITHPQPDRPLIGGPSPIERRPSRWLGRGLVGASIVTLAALTGINVRQDVPQEAINEGALRGMGPRPAASASPPPASPSPTEEPRRIRLVLRVTGAPAWVRVIRGERVLLEETLEPWSVQRFQAPRRLHLVLGNAGAVRLEVNGEPLAVPADSGQVYVGTVTLRGARVVLAPA
ncbi:MAG: helix-turn-helix domain-containing protein [Actinomycetota bacterium]